MRNDPASGTKEKFAHWVILDLFGHTRLAGYATEASIGGCSFIQLDVPATTTVAAFTRFFRNGAIYSMSPVSEEIARGLAEKCSQAAPVSAYELPKLTAAKESPVEPSNPFDDAVVFDDEESDLEHEEPPFPT